MSNSNTDCQAIFSQSMVHQMHIEVCAIDTLTKLNKTQTSVEAKYKLNSGTNSQEVILGSTLFNVTDCDMCKNFTLSLLDTKGALVTNGKLAINASDNSIKIPTNASLKESYTLKADFSATPECAGVFNAVTMPLNVEVCGLEKLSVKQTTRQFTIEIGKTPA